MAIGGSIAQSWFSARKATIVADLSLLFCKNCTQLCFIAILKHEFVAVHNPVPTATYYCDTLLLLALYPKVAVVNKITNSER